MKLLKRFSYFLLLLFILFGAVLAYHYKADIPVTDLKEKYTYPDSRFKKVNGMEVHYRVSGVGHPLVLLHGSGSSLHTWEKWIELLSKDFKVIVLDLPAFGLTGPHPDSDYSMEAYGQLLDRFLNKLNIDSCYLVGNSFGGHIAWTYALDYPQRVKKLALLNSSGYPGKSTGEVPLIYRLARNPIASKVLMKCTPRSLVERSVKETFVKKDMATDQMIDRYFDLNLRVGNRKAFVDRLRQSNKDYWPRLKELDKPVLLMWGDQDIVIHPDNAKEFESELKESELIMYEQVGHLPMEEIPSQSAVDLRAFLWKGNTQKTQLTSRELISDESE